MPDTAPYTPSPSLKQQPGTFTALQAALKTKYLSLGFSESEQEFHVRVRRLTSAEVDAADAYASGVVPPLNKQYAKVDQDGKPLFDFDNPSPELAAIIRKFIEDYPLPPYANDPTLTLRRFTFAKAADRLKYDYEDKGYLKESANAQAEQAAVLLDFAIEGGIPGDTAAAKSQALKSAFPDNVIALLVTKVLEISGRRMIETASFF